MGTNRKNMVLCRHVLNARASPLMMFRVPPTSPHVWRRASASSAASPASKPLKVTNRVSAEGRGMTSTLETGGFTIYADEPAKMGGNDKGPNPMQMCLASLVACNQATANAANQSLKLPIEKITYKSSGSFDARGFMGTADVPPQYTRVSVAAKVHPKVDSDVTEQQVAELAALVKKRCPVEALFRQAGVELDVSWSKA